MLEGFDARPQCLRPRSALLSAIVHAAVFLAIAVWVHRMPQIAPFKLPGTAKGVTVLTYYSPGSRQPAKVSPAVRVKQTKDSVASRVKTAAKADPAPAQPPQADLGSGNASESGVGDGNISIALVSHFPHPEPDLSGLPHGTKGDVILDAVIDAQGKITTLTLLKGLAPSIDDAVIATVREWLFIPAKKDGVPVVSEQELHFHYERG